MGSNYGGRPTAPPYQGWGSSYGQAAQGPYAGQPAQSAGYGGAHSGGYGQSEGYGSQPSQPVGYGSYGQYQQPYNQSYPPPQQSPYGLSVDASDSEIRQVFLAADRDGSGTIDAVELQRVLSGRSPTSMRTVRLMLHLFADNRNDTSRIGPHAFAQLWREIKLWQRKFETYDRDRSGTIDVSELQQVLLSFNYDIPVAVLRMLVSKFDQTGSGRSIGYDNFLECGFIVKGLTEKFKEMDYQVTGSATFNYEAFMLLVIPFIAA